MTIGLLFWILFVLTIVLYLIPGLGWWAMPMVFVLLFLLGWGQFGFVVKGP